MTDISTKDQLYAFVDDLERSLDFDFGMGFDVDNIVLCGVGGSAVSGIIAADCCFLGATCPIVPIKHTDLPNWVSERTLAVVSSYSGNTAETLEMYRQARERGCNIIAITSGGDLRRLAETNGDDVILLPTNMHPRHAIGYMIGYTIAVIRAAGGPDLITELRAMIPSLRQYRDSNVLSEGCLARRMADSLIGRVPVICADNSMQSVSFRWKTQINENSKLVAFCQDTPVFLSGENGGFAHESLVFIFLIGRDDDMCIGTDRLRELASSLKGQGATVHVIDLGGESSLENLFRAIILGDYISIYMAEIRGIDAAEVRPVMQMKAKLSEARSRNGA